MPTQFSATLLEEVRGSTTYKRQLLSHLYRSRGHFRPSASLFWPKRVPSRYRRGADSIGRVSSLAYLGEYHQEQAYHCLTGPIYLISLSCGASSHGSWALFPP